MAGDGFFFMCFSIRFFEAALMWEFPSHAISCNVFNRQPGRNPIYERNHGHTKSTAQALATVRMIDLVFHPMADADIISHGHRIHQGGGPFDVVFTANENQLEGKTQP